LALIGFVPYLYLSLREWQGGGWVYGEPGTPRGLWIEFSGKEAERFVKRRRPAGPVVQHQGVDDPARDRVGMLVK
jgi:hypothetical protein